MMMAVIWDPKAEINWPKNSFLKLADFNGDRSININLPLGEMILKIDEIIKDKAQLLLKNQMARVKNPNSSHEPDFPKNCQNGGKY